MNDKIGCGNHLEGWTSTFICGNIDEFTGKLILCLKCKKKCLKDEKQERREK